MRIKQVLIAFLLLGLLLAGCAAGPEMVVETVTVETVKTVEVQVAGETNLVKPTPEPGPGADEIAAQLPTGNSGRMIIKDAVIDLLVQNTDRALDQITQLAADQGGYVLSTRSWYDGEYKHAGLTMGIPSTTFESTLNYLRRLGVQVLNETTSGQDVSAEYTDLKSRLANLEATAARVRQFLDDAKTVEDALRINQTLSQLEDEIEQIKGQMRFYEGRSAYSTITVTLTPQMPTPTPTLTPTPTATPTPQPGWNPGRTAGAAAEIMVKMLQGLVDVLIWLVLLGWPFLLGAAILWWLARRFGRKPARPTVEKNE